LPEHETNRNTTIVYIIAPDLATTMGLAGNRIGKAEAPSRPPEERPAEGFGLGKVVWRQDIKI
jgi:hypothetical protein